MYHVILKVLQQNLLHQVYINKIQSHSQIEDVNKNKTRKSQLQANILSHL